MEITPADIHVPQPMKKKNYSIPGIAAVTLVCLEATSPGSESLLWGRNGERWTPESRLPDFSWAGYHSGDVPVPNVPTGVSVRDFGAKGDGKSDDTEAFLKALAEAKGAIEIPPGRYVIRKMLLLDRSGLVLRGAGPDQSILVCPVPLHEINPDWAQTTEGQKTSIYSWSGGIVKIQGNLQDSPLADISGTVKRSATSFDVTSTEGLKPGKWVLVSQSDTPDNSLAIHLYSDDAGEVDNLKGKTTARQPCQITAIQGNTVSISRPLRFDLRPEWKPKLLNFDPTVTECGIENLGFEFPNLPYGGHFTEVGYNAISTTGVANCWARNLRIHNSDSGIFLGGHFCTIDGVTVTSDRQPEPRGNTGHHGVALGGSDNVLVNFDFQTRFFHDVTVTAFAAGNVFENGKGIDLSLDLHRRAPYENLFSNIDAGEGTRLWKSGGGLKLGKHAAARNTFWSIRAKNPLQYPPDTFGAKSINLVGLFSKEKGTTDPSGIWFETFPDAEVTPANIYQAQLERRLGRK